MNFVVYHCGWYPEHTDGAYNPDNCRSASMCW